jgi:uncharacterized membrane protein YphA (DoxX/SURF4 family)
VAVDGAENRVHWAAVILRVGLAFIWIYEGLVPKLLIPLSELERAVVAASGLIPNGIEQPFIRCLGVLEILLGVLIAAGVWLRPLCVVQAGVVGFFTLVIPITHPTILAHPFGLLSKNVPIVAAIVALWLLSRVVENPPHQRE